MSLNSTVAFHDFDDPRAEGRQFTTRGVELSHEVVGLYLDGFGAMFGRLFCLLDACEALCV